MEKNNNTLVSERLLGILFGVCATLTILPIFQKLNDVAPLQEIALIVGIIVLVGLSRISHK